MPRRKPPHPLDKMHCRAEYVQWVREEAARLNCPMHQVATQIVGEYIKRQEEERK